MELYIHTHKHRDTDIHNYNYNDKRIDKYNFYLKLHSYMDKLCHFHF